MDASSAVELPEGWTIEDYDPDAPVMPLAESCDEGED